MPGVGFSGKDGDVKIGSTAICEIKGWSFNPKATNPSYASNKTAGFKRRVGGVKEGSGTLSGAVDMTTPHWTVIEVATAVTLKLYLNGTYFFEVPSVIDDYKVNVDLDSGEIVSWEANFSTNGAWTNPVIAMQAPEELRQPGSIGTLPLPASGQDLGIVAAFNADVLRETGQLTGTQDIAAVAKQAALEALREAIAQGILKVAETPRPMTTEAAPVKMTDNGPKAADDAAKFQLGASEGTVAL